MTLYAYVTSPFSMKVQAYLLYKKIPFRIVYVNPVAPEKTLPIGRSVPVLKVGEHAMSDSHEIGVWLNQRFAERPLYTENDDVIAADLGLNQTLIPMVFYSVYPQFDRDLGGKLKNTLRLGYCVDKTTAGGLPRGIRYLWPLFIRNAGFIQMLIKDIKTVHGNADTCRQSILKQLDETLQNKNFLASTNHPTLADISAWPLLVVPYQLRLAGFDDFKAYPSIMRWINDIKPMLLSSDQSPWFVPNEMSPLPI